MYIDVATECDIGTDLIVFSSLEKIENGFMRY